MGHSSRALVLALLLLSLGACHGRLRVTHNPYAQVDWGSIHALKMQLHEHVRDNPVLLQRMDDAGYDVVPLMHYSGVESRDYPWRERHWPPEQFLPAEFIAGLKHIKLFYPNAEEVGFFHLLSPFLTTYIARGPRHREHQKPWQYGSTQEAIDLIRRFGGLPFIAHPWKDARQYAGLHGFTGMELYNAYCRAKFQSGEHKRDTNPKLLHEWDLTLLRDPTVVGIAVNDWFGPGTADPRTKPDTFDSGKIIVLAKNVTLADVRAALASGAVFAIKDIGRIKDGFPRVRAIGVSDAAIRLTLASPGAKVKWLADGAPLADQGPVLQLSTVPPSTHYVRAEIVNHDGSTTYTQAFGMSPVQSTAAEPNHLSVSLWDAITRWLPVHRAG